MISLPLCNAYLQDRRGGRTPRLRGTAPVHELAAAGIPVAVASDNVRDPFYAYGDLDLMEVFRTAVRLQHLDHPVAAWPAAIAATAGELMGLQGVGRIAPGGPADLIAFTARGWSELIARPQADRVVIRQGVQIDDAPPDFRELDDLEGFEMQQITELIAELDGIPVETHPRRVQMKSRDFYWYSPILKPQLDPYAADLLVTPRSESEVARVLAACFARDIPVTPRGAGTGNYGQAVPLAGGVVLDLSAMTRIASIAGGRAVVEPGVVLLDLESRARAEAGRELRMHPSTAETATVGGFVAGGSAGVGSIRWGGLYDRGNILRLRVMSMEAEPRAIELLGDDVRLAQHAYGTTGIITEIELPLAPAPEWVDVLVGFDDWIAGLRCGEALAFENGILLRQLAMIEAPVPHDYFKRHQKLLRRDQSLMVATVAIESREPLLDSVGRAGGDILYRADTATSAESEGLPAAYLLCWNHTTLRALRVDPAITYLQVGYPEPDPIGAIERLGRRLGGEVPGHVEFRRSGRGSALSGLPLVRFTTPERFAEIIAIHEAEGCTNWSAHHYTLEEGGSRTPDLAKLEFKRRVDRKGLLNPGKMIAFEDPDYDFASRIPYRYPGIRGMRS